MPPKNQYKIKQISALETHDVRHPILRKGRPKASCIFDGDDLESTIHLGLFIKNKLVGVATFVKNSNNLLKNESQYQLRGMAILNAYQGLGLGNLILAYGEEILMKKSVSILWCNAREVAKNFYAKNGYSVIGKPFEIPKIGKHYIMFKAL